MSNATLQKDIALRIGLAARELPDTDAARLLGVLADAVGLPPTAETLAGLTVKTLKSAADGELSDIDVAALKSALAYLKGEAEFTAESLPELETYGEGDMPNSIRVACASNNAEALDGHFGSCKRFLIYQVSREELRLVDIRDTAEDQPVDDKNAYRASLIADCQLLFVVSIGGPAAAKVVRAGVHPVKVAEAGDARAVVAGLQARIGPDAPPWLAKSMGQTAEERVRFAQEAEA